MNGNSSTNLFVLFCRNNTLGLFVNDRQSPSLQLTEQSCVPLFFCVFKIIFFFFGKVFFLHSVLRSMQFWLIERNHQSYKHTMVIQKLWIYKAANKIPPSPILTWYFYFFYLCVSGGWLCLFVFFFAGVLIFFSCQGEVNRIPTQ